MRPNRPTREAEQRMYDGSGSALESFLVLVDHFRKRVEEGRGKRKDERGKTEEGGGKCEV